MTRILDYRPILKTIMLVYLCHSRYWEAGLLEECYTALHLHLIAELVFLCHIYNICKCLILPREAGWKQLCLAVERKQRTCSRVCIFKTN